MGVVEDDQGVGQCAVDEVGAAVEGAGLGVEIRESGFVGGNQPLEHLGLAALLCQMLGRDQGRANRHDTARMAW